MHAVLQVVSQRLFQMQHGHLSRSPSSSHTATERDREDTDESKSI